MFVAARIFSGEKNRWDCGGTAGFLRCEVWVVPKFIRLHCNMSFLVVNVYVSKMYMASETTPCKTEENRCGILHWYNTHKMATAVNLSVFVVMSCVIMV
jgi:hypothetical protein